jgi:hypothetical protein
VQRARRQKTQAPPKINLPILILVSIFLIPFFFVFGIRAKMSQVRIVAKQPLASVGGGCEGLGLDVPHSETRGREHVLSFFAFDGLVVLSPNMRVQELNAWYIATENALRDHRAMVAATAAAAKEVDANASISGIKIAAERKVGQFSAAAIGFSRDRDSVKHELATLTDAYTKARKLLKTKLAQADEGVQPTEAKLKRARLDLDVAERMQPQDTAQRALVAAKAQQKKSITTLKDAQANNPLF